MGFFKKLFGLEKEDAVPDDIPQKPTHVQEDGKRYVDRECFYCKDIIGPERYSHTQGKYFHKKCLKIAKKSAMSGNYGA